MYKKFGMIIKNLFKGIAGDKPHIDNIYCLEGRVPLAKAFPFGFQHVMAMLAANIVPIILVASAAVMLAAGLFPPVAALLATMPESVLGGCTIIMFGQIVISGIDMIKHCGFTGLRRCMLRL